MGAWMKVCVFALFALGLLPFALTWLLFVSARYDNEKARVRKVRLPGLLLNILLNAACLYGAAALLYETGTPWLPALRLLRPEGSWQGLYSLALTDAVGMAFGAVWGVLLRRLLLRKDRTAVIAGRRSAALLLCAVCGGTVFFACAGSVRANNAVVLTEVCRKTAVYVIDPNQEEELGDGGREISYVVLSNPGWLDCTFETLYLSETEEDPLALPFREVTVPARGTCRLTMDWEHGLDLKKGGGTTVYLRAREDTVLSRVKIPALEEHQSYRLSPETGAWEVYAYAERTERTLEAPVFSRESGFYDEGFDLEISAPPGTEIYYTLDCSDPDKNGIRYTGPVRIEDPTPNANVWSARTDVSASFLTEDQRFAVPGEPVDKCAVVRAVCRDAEGNLSAAVTASYFIGYGEREGYNGIGVISVATDPENLFSEDKGIYVLGNLFRDKHAMDREDRGWWWWSANYRGTGRGWEREASIQFFDTERKQQLSKEIGIRVKGAVSRAFLPKGLNIHARIEYDGQPVFDADLFGNGYRAGALSLASGGNDVKLKVRDWLTTRLAGDLGVAMYRFVPYALFLDGEYWGNYWLTEQFDSEYFAFYYGLNAENVAVIKSGDLKDGLPKDKSQFTKMRKYFMATDMSDPDNYLEACGMVDTENFALVYALEMYVANHDRGLYRNSAFWRARKEEDAPAGDTRWRQAVFDTNNLSCYGDPEADTLAYMLEVDEVFSSLMNSPDFRRMFYTDLRKLAEDVFSPERADEALTEYVTLMEEPIELEHLRFYNRRTGLKNLEDIRGFIRDRQAYILNLCAEQGY